MGLSGSQLAYKQARFGIARMGASRIGFFTPNVVLQINGVDRSTGVGGILAGSLHITQAINDEPDTAYFTITPQPDAVFPYADAIVADGPASYWPLNGTLTASVGSVSLIPSGTLIYGQPGPLSDGTTAILLNGTDTYITAGDNYDFAGTSSGSVEIFLNLAANHATQFVRILSKEVTDGGGAQGWTIGIDPQSAGSPRVVFFDRKQNGTTTSYRSTTQLTVGTYAHVVCTYNGSTQRIYINGVEEGSGLASSLSIVNHSTDLHIGRRSDSSTAFLNATISNIAIYNSVLTQPQIAAHYALRTATALARPVAGQQVVIGLGDSMHREFAGQILRVTHRRLRSRSSPVVFVDVDCIDWQRRFDARTITREYTSKSATFIAQDIIDTYCLDFTRKSVAEGLPTIDYFPLTREQPSRALRRLTALIGGLSGFKIDEHRDVHLWGSGGESGSRAPTPPVTLTNSLASLKTFSHTRDVSQIRTIGICEGMRTTVSLIAILAGVTSVPVEDEAPFKGFGLSGSARIGRQLVTFTSITGTWAIDDPAGRNRPGTNVRTAAAIGATQLDVDDTAPLASSSNWVRVGDQVIHFTGVGGPPDFINGIPATGYGSIQRPIPVGTEVVTNPSLIGIPASGAGSILSDEPAGTEVVVYTSFENTAAAANLAVIEGFDGLYEHVVADVRLPKDSTLVRAVKECAAFPSAELSAVWDTEDMNARPGTRQVINLAAPDALSAAVTIMRSTLTFRVPNRRPLRRCEAATVRPARVLDVLEQERS